MRSFTPRSLCVAGFPLLVAASIASAQSQVTITPQKGQTPDVVAKDQAECSSAATGSTGYNPSAAAPPVGGRAAGAAKGAALGAAGAEMRGRANGGEVYEHAGSDAKQQYRQENARDAAKVGAAVGGIQQRHERRENASAAQAWDKSFRSCLTSRGYTVK